MTKRCPSGVGDWRSSRIVSIMGPVRFDRAQQLAYPLGIRVYTTTYNSAGFSLAGSMAASNSASRSKMYWSDPWVQNLANVMCKGSPELNREQPFRNRAIQLKIQLPLHVVQRKRKKKLSPSPRLHFFCSTRVCVHDNIKKLTVHATTKINFARV